MGQPDKIGGESSSGILTKEPKNGRLTDCSFSSTTSFSTAHPGPSTALAAIGGAMRIKSLSYALYALFSFILVACGGGGGPDGSGPPPAQQPPPPVPNSNSAADPMPKAALDMVRAAATTAATATTPLPIVSAGEIQIDGAQQFVTLVPFTAADGKKYYYGLSDQLGTYLVDPADVKQVCYNSSQVGWNVPGFTSRSCAPLDANGFVSLPRTCNKDIGTWNLDTLSGKKLWFDFTSQRAFVRKGIASAVQPNGLVSYGGFQPAQISAKPGTTPNTVDLKLEFKNNCMGGFGLDGKLTDLNPNLDPSDPNFRFVAFLWNSNKAGWGIVPVADRVPSTKLAFASFDVNSNGYEVEFKGLACNDFGNVTVYKGTGTSDNVTYDPGTDAKGQVGFGAGWFIIQNAADPFQFWSISGGLPTGMSLSFDRTKFTINWSLAGCTT
jgi:hypothetical protein